MNLAAIRFSFVVGLCLCTKDLGPEWRGGISHGFGRIGLVEQYKGKVLPSSTEDAKASEGGNDGKLLQTIVEDRNVIEVEYEGKALLASGEDKNNIGDFNLGGHGGQMKCTISKYFCNPTGADVIEHIDNEVRSFDECFEMCLTDQKCKFYTFIKFRGNPSCFLLRSCYDKKPKCTVPGTCVTGKINCKDVIPCPRLKLNTDDEYLAHWRCKGINPYNEEIPSHVTCHTRCPAWTNAAGDNITAVSTCQPDGTWSDPIPQPFGPLFHPPVLNKPDGPDMRCGGCKPLNITYDPNKERGAEFFCNPPINFDNLPARIDNTAKCNLLCDKMLEAVVECKNSVWTGYPELGFYCSEKKPAIFYWEA